MKKEEKYQAPELENSPYIVNRVEFAGSLGDLGTLLPIAIGMIVLNGLNATNVMVTVGLFYVLSGLYFKVPVPVQPMKVIGAYAIAVGLTPRRNLDLKVLKQSAGFTMDGATSSKKLLTLQRNNLTNNLWFTSEYFTGITAKEKIDESWSYKVGLFSSDGNNELSRFEASYFTLFSLGYGFAKSPKLDHGQIRIDYVYNDEDINADTRYFSQVLSLATKWETGPWGLWRDLSAGKGYAKQSDVWGLVLMPFYDFNPYIQVVMRYTYLNSADDNGLRLPRYEGKITDGRGNEYSEIYAGLNVFFYGHKFKWQTGLEYASMRDGADDESEYKGWGVNTGLRLYWLFWQQTQ